MINKKNVVQDNGNGKYTGMVGFTFLWIGQLVSLFGSAMTSFGIMIWVWKTTGQATPFALYGFAMAVPLIVAYPLAGVFVDRWNRKLTMAISDLVAGLSSVIILILHTTGNLAMWHLYILAVLAGFFSAFQTPAFSSAITMLVSKENYARASGMMSVAETFSGLAAPVLAAVLLEQIGLRGILMIDIVTFSFAVGVLVFIFIPKPPVSEEGLESLGSVWQEALYGFRYIYQRKSLLGLLIVFLMMNMSLSFSNVLRVPMIMARSENNEMLMAIANSFTTIGGLVGGLILMVWGGPKKKIRGLFVAMAFMGIGVFLGGCGEGLVVWALSGFIMVFCGVMANASSQAFWQSKVVPDVQGRVFSARSMIGGVARPLALLISGPLADKVFEPAMSNGGTLAKLFGWLTGIEPGAGFSLLFVITGLFCFGTAAVGYMFKSIKDVDSILPDYDVKIGSSVGI